MSVIGRSSQKCRMCNSYNLQMVSVVTWGHVLMCPVCDAGHSDGRRETPSWETPGHQPKPLEGRA